MADFMVYLDVGSKNGLYIKTHESMVEAIADVKKTFPTAHILGDVCQRGEVYNVWQSYGDFMASKRAIGRIRVKEESKQLQWIPVVK